MPSLPLPVFDTVRVPELERVPPLLTMPMKLVPVFDTVSVPVFVRVPWFWIPLLPPEFDTVSVPKLVRKPPELIVMSTPAEFDKTKLIPLGMNKVWPEDTVMPLVIVHVSTPFHVPPNVGWHVVLLTLPPTA